MPIPGWVGLRDIQEKNQIQSTPEGQSGVRSTDTPTDIQTDTQIWWQGTQCHVGTLRTGSQGRLPREDLTGEARGEAAIRAFTFCTFVGR